MSKSKRGGWTELLLLEGLALIIGSVALGFAEMIKRVLWPGRGGH